MKAARREGDLLNCSGYSALVTTLHFLDVVISLNYLKGIVHNFFVYRSNLIFWIVMGCGIADFGRRGL